MKYFVDNKTFQLNKGNLIIIPNNTLHRNDSESYISRRFKSTVGVSINEYINFIRVSKAVEILESKKMPITEIAINCGFNDSNYFSTVFKKLKGVTPYKYMKANRGE